MNVWDRNSNDSRELRAREARDASVGNRILDKSVQGNKPVSYSPNISQDQGQWRNCRPDAPFSCQQNNVDIYNLSDYKVRPEYTQMSNPTSTARELGINRFAPVNRNPQNDQFYLVDRIGLNSTQHAIDSYMSNK